jgi:membrane-associated phospholipid phosphatase
MTPAFLEKPTPACLPHCSPADVNALDRLVIGKYSPTARTAADVAVLSLALLPLLIDLIDSGGDGWLTDSVVYGQSLMIAQGATQLTKRAVRRPAPFVYDERVPLEVRQSDPDAALSFWSGHAATAFTAAASTSTTFWLRHPESPWRWLVIAGSAAAATSVGLLKIHAGYHYPSDILAGAAAGVASGVLVPVLHL